MPKTFIRIEYDEDPELSWLELPENAENKRAYEREDFTFVGAVVIEECECCGQDKVVDDCWGFDLYHDDPLLQAHGLIGGRFEHSFFAHASGAKDSPFAAVILMHFPLPEAA